MITVSEAFALLQQNLPQPRTEEQRLAEAHGYYLAADVLAPEPSPRFTNSAMDGYAVRAADALTASQDNPVTLYLVGESRAGEPFPDTVGPGEAIRISTGAMLPAGTDTIIRVEDTSESDNAVQIFTAARSGQDVRQAGEEFEKGEKLLPAGTRLGSRQLALLAAVGFDRVPVFAKPRVAIIGTGSELIVGADQEVQTHQIRDSNTIMLTSAVQECSGEVIDCRHVADDLEATVAALQKAMADGPDIILCSGGVSVGRHDHVKEAAVQTGFAEIFWRIRQKPGKPLFLARHGDTLLFGLPGNPVSAFMCFTHYVRPVLAWLHSLSLTQPSVTAQAGETISNTGKRTNFMRVTINHQPGSIPAISSVAKQGSHMLSSIVLADGYIILEPGETVEPGGLVEVFLL